MTTTNSNSQYKNFSILDKSPIGFNKTSDVIERNRGTGYLHILPNYELCEEIASKNPNGFVLYGKPHFCKKITDEIYKFIFPTCNGCEIADQCKYFKQKEKGQGKDIYTIPQLLDLARAWYKPQTIVFDDVSIIDIIYQTEDLTFLEIQQLNDFLCEKYPYMFKVAQMFANVSFLQDEGKEILNFIRKHKKEIEQEYKEIRQIWESVKVKVKIFHLLLKAKNLWVVGIIDGKGKPLIRICSKIYDKRNFKNNRLEYINATPQKIEIELFKSISPLPIKRIEKEAQVRENTTIIQITDAKYPTTTILSKHNSKFKKVNQSINDFIEKPVKSLNLGVVLFLSKSTENIILPCYKNFNHEKKEGEARSKNAKKSVTNSKQQGDDLIPILLYGKGSSGTNNLMNNTLGIIAGISYLPFSFYLKPPYIEDFSLLRSIIEEKIKEDKSLFEEYENIKRAYKNKIEKYEELDRNIYKVFYESLKLCGVDSTEIPKCKVIQAIGRIARGKDTRKLIIVISSLQIDKYGFVPEVGVFVKKTRICNLINELKDWFKPLLLKEVIEKKRLEIDKITRKKAEDLAKKLGVFSWSWYYKKLKGDDAEELRELRHELSELCWEIYNKPFDSKFGVEIEELSLEKIRSAINSLKKLRGELAKELAKTSYQELQKEVENLCMKIYGKQHFEIFGFSEFSVAELLEQKELLMKKLKN